MKPLKLYTRSGELVAEVLALPFQEPPEVVCWGERYFSLRNDGTHRECFCYRVLAYTNYVNYEKAE